MVFQSIKNVCQAYYNDLPNDTFQTIGKSALFSFTVTLLLTNSLRKLNDAPINFARPLVAAGVAVTASLIHALTTPIFNYIFGDKETKIYREVLKYFINLSCTYLIFNRLTPYKTHAFALNVFQAWSLNFLKSICEVAPAIIDAVESHLLQRQPIIGDVIRNIVLQPLGVKIEQDSNSTYFVFTDAMPFW